MGSNEKHEKHVNELTKKVCDDVRNIREDFLCFD
jgi:hypothetical protein